MNKKTAISDTNLFLYVSVILFSLSLLSFSILASNSSVATSSSTDHIDNVDITVPVSCRLASVVDSAHSATIPNGIYSVNYTAEGGARPYENGIGQTTITAYCNDNNGFSIYAIGYSNNEYGNTNLIGANTNTLIATGTATSGDTSNWAMKLAKVTGTYEPIIVGTTDDTEKDGNTPNYSTYQAVPSTYTRVAYKNSATDIGTNPTGSSLTTTYAAYISRTQPADTYAGQVKYTLTHPASEEPAQPRATTSGQICYYANASSAVGTMGCQTIPASGGTATTVTPTSATLLASNYSRSGYGFAGWSNKFDYATNTDNDLKFYGPQEYIEFTEGQYSGDNPGLSLYAVWVKSAGNLQGWNGCSSLTTAPTNGTANLSSVTALTDQRDGETYAVARLADGNCWMIENLRLEAEYSADESLAQGFAKSTTYGNFEGLATAESENFNDTNPLVANSKYSADGSNDTINIGSSPYRMPRYNNLNTQNRAISPTSNIFDDDNTTGGMYSYGNYYTWPAALANTIFYSSPSATDADGKTSETVNTSLCPNGWRLPRGGNKGRLSTNDLWALVVTGVNGGVNPANYNNYYTPSYEGLSEARPVANKLRSFPNNSIYSGYFISSSNTNRGGSGLYWVSTTYGNFYPYYLYIRDSEVIPGTSYSFRSYVGGSIRCMLGSGA